MKFLSDESLKRKQEEERRHLSFYLYWFSNYEIELEVIRELKFSDIRVKIYSNSSPIYLLFEVTNNFLKMKTKDYIR